MIEEELQIGTVLKLKNIPLQLMITGYDYTYNGKKFDYISTIHPVGIDYITKDTDKSIIFFNQEDIEEIYFLGYRDKKVEERRLHQENIRIARKRKEKKMFKDKLLPLGTIVRLKKSDAALMIMGYGLKHNETGKMYDYSAVIFPVGFEVEKFKLFNKEDIENVLFLGYQTPQSIQYRELMGDYFNDIKSGTPLEEADKKMMDKLSKLGGKTNG